MFAPRTHHRGGIRLELQVLGMEPRRYLLKVVHLVDVHVVVRSEEQEPLIGVVLNQLRDDDELAGTRRLDDSGAVALREHIAQFVIGNLVVRVKLDLGIHVSCPFCP